MNGGETKTSAPYQQITYNITISSFKICRDREKKQYVSYIVAVCMYGQNVVERLRRYSHFETLHKRLTAMGVENLPPLPPKTCSWRAFDAREFLERRKTQLERYVVAVTKLPGCVSTPVLNSFLGLGAESVSNEMCSLTITVEAARHLSPVFNPSLCSLSTGSQTYTATYIDTEVVPGEYRTQEMEDTTTISHTFSVNNNFLGRLKEGETDLQVVFEDFSGKHRCGTTIDIGSLGGGWRSRPLVAARQAFITGDMPDNFALDTWLVLSGVDDGEVHLIIHGQKVGVTSSKNDQVRASELSHLPWAGMDMEMMREDEMARKKLKVQRLLNHKKRLTEEEAEKVHGRGEYKNGAPSSRDGYIRGNSRSSSGGGDGSIEHDTIGTPTSNADEWFDVNLPRDLVDEYNYKVLDVRQWIRARQYLLCRGERQIDRWHRYLLSTKPSFHDVNGWHCNDRRLRILTYGGIPSALCVAFHPEMLTFRNGIFSTLRPTLWKLFSGANRLKQQQLSNTTSSGNSSNSRNGSSSSSSSSSSSGGGGGGGSSSRSNGTSGKHSGATTIGGTCTLNYRILCQIESHKDWLDRRQTDHAHFLLASLQFDQIELDITRTEETITSAETAALRRILRAFCLRNPKVGYCQAMNFVAISLLRAARTGSLSEEDAFWLLVAVCEEIVPYYYVKEMSGVKVATAILKGLIHRRFPRLSVHLSELQFPVELFSIPWICSLFSSSFPAETVYRIWDALFLNGADTLFYVTMAFLRIHSHSLLSKTSMMDANMFIKDVSEKCYDVETLMEYALEERNISMEYVSALKEEFYSSSSNQRDETKYNSSVTATTSAKDLVRSTPLQRSDIESLLGDLMFARHQSSKSSSATSSRGGGENNVSIQYDEKEFQKCIQRLLTNLDRHDQRVQIWHSVAFDIFSTNKGLVNLQRFTCVLALFHRGTSVDERLKLCFSCYDIGQQGSISVTNFKNVLRAAYSFFCPNIDSNDIDNLADKVVKNIPRTKKIMFDEFSSILLNIPVLGDLVVDRGGENDTPFKYE